MVIVRVSDLTAIFAILHDGITLIQDNVCATFYALLIRHEKNPSMCIYANTESDALYVSESSIHSLQLLITQYLAKQKSK